MKPILAHSRQELALNAPIGESCAEYPPRDVLEPYLSRLRKPWRKLSQSLVIAR
jgi:hypothetical protein